LPRQIRTTHTYTQYTHKDRHTHSQTRTHAHTYARELSTGNEL